MIRELIEKRNLIYELILKDLKIRYSSPMLGFLWLFISPFFISLILYLVFSLILNVKTEEAPFFLYLVSAIFPWSFFQNSMIAATTSLIDNKNLIKESSFPHYFIPISIVLVNAISFLAPLAIIVLVSFFVLHGFSIYILFLPFILLMHILLTSGLAILFSVIYVKWRDIKYVLEIILLILFYFTPVFYSLNLVKGAFSPFLFKLYIYNPFVCILSFYRVSLIDGYYKFIYFDMNLLMITISISLFTAFIILLGLYFYKKSKDRINDYLSY